MRLLRIGQAGTIAAAWLVAAGLAASPHGGQRAPDDLIERARGAWAAFETALGSVVADEEYRQEARWPDAPSDGAVVRVLRAEVVIFQVPDSTEWVTFRHVREVDGAPPPEPPPSIVDTLADTSRPMSARIGALVRASARDNLGDIERTINTPTFAPILLRAAHRRHARFRVEGDETVAGVRARIVRFEETARPTIVRGPSGRRLPMRGRLWIDPGSARVLRSALTFEDRGSALTAVIDVEYGHDAGLDMLVPQVMRERYERRGHVVTTEARYRNYRRFTTSARIIGDGR